MLKRVPNLSRLSRHPRNAHVEARPQLVSGNGEHMPTQGHDSRRRPVLVSSRAWRQVVHHRSWIIIGACSVMALCACGSGGTGSSDEASGGGQTTTAQGGGGGRETTSGDPTDDDASVDRDAGADNVNADPGAGTRGAPSDPAGGRAGQGGVPGSGGTGGSNEPPAPGSIVDAGAGSANDDPDSAASPPVSECPPDRPSGPARCSVNHPLGCTYGSVECVCDWSYIGWRCAEPGQCPAEPADRATCDAPDMQCSYGDVGCTCDESTGRWACVGPTGCPVDERTVFCDPSFDLLCAYATGDLCRCEDDGRFRCIDQQCVFEPTHGEPCTSSPPPGCGNSTTDQRCVCNEDTASWWCVPEGCPPNNPESGAQCGSGMFVVTLVDPSTQCDYPDAICRCPALPPTIPLSSWICEDRP